MQNNEVKFLLALTASEDAPTNEIFFGFSHRGAESEQVFGCLQELIADDVVAFYRYSAGEAIDLSPAEVKRLQWKNLQEPDLSIYLTKKGSEVWETEDWGFTKEQARTLMFGSGSEIRVPASRGFLAWLGRLIGRR